MAGLKQRGSTWYLTYYAGKTRWAISLNTDSLQIAKERKRQFESAQLRGHDSPLPTQTSIGTVVGKYVEHIRTHKTANSAQKDVYCLRDAFGVVCPDPWPSPAARRARPLGSDLPCPTSTAADARC